MKTEKEASQVELRNNISDKPSKGDFVYLKDFT
jgi:hypothetical protein